MLDDHDRRALEEIERHLARQDPTLTARLGGAPARPSPTMPLLFGGLYVSAPIMTLLFGRPGLAVTIGTYTAAMLAVLLFRRSRH